MFQPDTCVSAAGSDSGRDAVDGTLSLAELQALLGLDEEAMKEVVATDRKFPMKIPVYYARLMMVSPVLQQVIVPSKQELIAYDDDDSCDVHADESQYQPVEGIVHRYPGKLLFIPTLKCFGHCRFCYRSGYRVKPLSAQKVDAAINYISEHDIREVLITGGDPLTLPLEQLEDILARIRAIEHVEIIRIGTRALAYEPHVMTAEMVAMLARYKPLYLSLSFVHPDEITDLCRGKLNMLAEAGIVMLQQGPLLKGINDDVAVLKSMYETLAKNRVLAYYAAYGIIAPGVRHFMVNRDEARQLFMQLENNTSGYCLPHLITLDQANNKTRSVL